MLRYTIILLTLAIHSGCTHERIVSRSDYESLSDINVRAARQVAHVRMLDGSLETVSALSASTDSTKWMDASHELVTVPTSKLVEVRFIRRGRGVFEGTRAGSLIGVAAGAMYGATVRIDEEADWLGLERPYQILSKAGLGGLVGLIIGGVYGAWHGSPDIYAFDATWRKESPPEKPQATN